MTLRTILEPASKLPDVGGIGREIGLTISKPSANKGLSEFRQSGACARKPNKVGGNAGFDSENPRNKSRNDLDVLGTFVLIVECDHGGYQIGLDGQGVFPSRSFAAAVTVLEARR